MGNTQAVPKVLEGDALRACWQVVATEAHRLADEIGFSCASLLGLRNRRRGAGRLPSAIGSLRRNRHSV
jgi:hypothetical protein